MTPSTIRLKQLAALATFESSIWESEEDAPQAWRDNRENNANWCRAANPEAVLRLIARIEKLEAALEHIAKIDTCSTQPDLVWLSDWRNETKRFANEALRGES